MAEMDARFGTDARLKKSAGGAVRESRDTSDSPRVEQDGTVMSVKDRIRSMRGEMGQEILPQPPVVPGWHFCWLSSTSQVDPIYVRMNKYGYEPVKAADIPGYAQYRISSGDFEGCVACNEMILFKVPEEIYQELMLINHHEKPLESEQEIKGALTRQELSRSGRKHAMEVDGFDTLARAVPTPTFS